MSQERVGRVGRGCYEDPREDIRNKSCMRVGLVEFGERHDTRTNGQQYKLHRSRPPADPRGKRVAS